MVRVAINIAGNAANIPPIAGPAVFAISTVNITTRPPNKERITRCFFVCPVLSDCTDFITKNFSSIKYEKTIAIKQITRFSIKLSKRNNTMIPEEINHKHRLDKRAIKNPLRAMDAKTIRNKPAIAIATGNMVVADEAISGD